MSHEIRTPMNAVIGMSGLLIDTALNDEQPDHARTFRDSGAALLGIIKDILDFSKFEAGQMDIEKHPFDLRDCIEPAIDQISTRAAKSVSILPRSLTIRLRARSAPTSCACASSC